MNYRYGSVAFLGVILLIVGACAPAAAPTPTAAPSKPVPTAEPTKPAPAPTKPAATAEPAKPAADAAKPAAKPADTGEWDKVLAAAKKEGKVTVAGPPGTPYRDVMTVFEKRYPDIKLEFQAFTPTTFGARFSKEREAGQYLWDVYITGPTSFDITGKKAGEFVPLRPALLLPEVLDEKVWFGGFEKAYLDKEKQYVFAFQAETSAQAFVNRDIVKESDLNTIKGLLEPKWKGKIAIYDPRVDGIGNGRVAAWTGLLGEDFVRSLLKQDVGLSRDDRQLTEWIVRGQYPIAVGISDTALFEFQKQGLGKNVVPLGSKNEAAAWRLSTAYGSVRLISKPPNPNAAKVFANWLLSKEGQTAWVEKTNRASRRMDVPQIEGTSPVPGVDYTDIDREEALPLRDAAKRLSEEVLK